MQISDNKPQPIPEPPLDLDFIASPLKIKPANMEERRYPTSKIKEVFDVPLSCLSFIFLEIKDFEPASYFSFCSTTRGRNACILNYTISKS